MGIKFKFYKSYNTKNKYFIIARIKILFLIDNWD